MKSRNGFVSNSSTSSFIAVVAPFDERFTEEEMIAILLKDDIDISKVTDIVDKFYDTYFYGREGVPYVGLEIMSWSDEILDAELDLSPVEKYRERVSYLLDVPIDTVKLKVGIYYS